MAVGFENFLHNLGVKHVISSLYYPRANTEVERWNRVLKQTLQLAIFGPETMEICYTRTVAPDQTTGKIPAELLHNWKMVDSAPSMDHEGQGPPCCIKRIYSSCRITFLPFFLRHN